MSCCDRLDPMLLAGAALVGAGVVASWRRGRPAAALDVTAWTGWATVAGVGLIYAGSRGARR